MFCSVVLNILAVDYIDESNTSMIIEMTKMTKTMLGRGNYLYYIYDKTKKNQKEKSHLNYTVIKQRVLYIQTVDVFCIDVCE